MDNNSPPKDDKPKFDFIQRDPNDRALLYVDHQECKGTFTMQKFTFGVRLALGRTKSAALGPFPDPDTLDAAEHFAVVSHGFSDVPDKFNPEEIISESLMVALYEEVVAYWALFRDPLKIRAI